MAILVLVLLVLGITSNSQAGPEYDFEDDDLSVAAPGFSSEGSRRLSISKLKHKGGERSLLWEWGPAQTINDQAKLLVNLKDTPGTDLSIKDDEIKKGGLKFWMYHDNDAVQSNPEMEIFFHGSSSSSSSSDVNLDFKGWRAVWIGYAEFFEATRVEPNNDEQIPKNEKSCKTRMDSLKLKEGLGFDVINSVEFRVTSPSADDKLYIDLVRFVPKMNKQTRDAVLPQVSSTKRKDATDELTFYDEKDFWQMSLRWHEVTPSFCTNTNQIPTQKEKDDVSEIEKKLENWYATDEQILKFDDGLTSLGTQSSQKTSFKDFQYERWKSLLKNIKKAHDLLDKILENRPTLFAHLSDIGQEEKISGPNAKTKFGIVFIDILLPLSVEYNFRGRKHNLANFDNVKDDACDDINDDPLLKNIVELLLYIEEQGWAEGSGLGTLAHEMNKSGAGFMHSMFLLRRVLKRRCPKLFERLLKSMKWYNDFNEIYQKKNDYIYDGTTADRMRTILLYKLMIILMKTNKDEQVRDMKCFRNWVKNILKVNKGLGGLVKPDYTGFHHKAFYGSAYVPQALHNAALVQYLLQGTSHSLDSEPKQNLRKALEVLRMVAVKYSTPNGICGRFPKYDNAILAEHSPAYAYISYVLGYPNHFTVDRPGMFLRLTDSLEEPALKSYLENGEIQSSIHYWNTIGSLDILDKVKTASGVRTAEKPPTGHWSKNFAALSIHRRDGWSVAAKGFNQYTWDYEKSDNQNVYGVFHSHGSLQISNSEADLKTYDVENGWDWTKIPGATTINVDLDNLVTDKGRYYNPGHFAGGVSLIGSTIASSKPQNGAFGMKLEKTHYEMKTNKVSPLTKMDFKFRKSYFFYDHLIVCIGSDINLDYADDNYYAQTTLFQDKLVNPSQLRTISIDNKNYDLRLLLKDWKSNKAAQTISLTDTLGNKYHVKTDKNTELHVKISDQESRKSNGCRDKTKARYATSWLIHKKVKKNKNKNKKNKNGYEYAILIKGGNQDLLSNYEVMRLKKNKAHAVKITTNNNEAVYGYAIFNNIKNNNFGPVKKTDSSCMIMAKKASGSLYLSISNPSLEFQDIDLQQVNPRKKNTCSGTNRRDEGCGAYSPLSSDDVHSKMMFCVKGKEKTVTVTLNCDFGDSDIVSVKVDGKDIQENDNYVIKLKRKVVQFLNLVDGFTTEIHIRNPQCNYV